MTDEVKEIQEQQAPKAEVETDEISEQPAAEAIEEPDEL